MLAVSTTSAPALPATGEVALVERIQAAYHDQPTLRLTLGQAARLWHVDRLMCARLLHQLIDAHVLTRTADGRFALERQPR